MSEQQRMRDLTDVVEGALCSLARLLEVSPYMQGAPEGTKARVWATVLSKAQHRYHDELVRLMAARKP